MLISTIFVIIIHLLITWMRKSVILVDEQTKCNWMVKIFNFWINKAFDILTYGYYIRMILETYQQLLVTSINEINQFNISSKLRIISLSIAILVWFLWLSLLVLLFWLSISKYELIEDKHNKLGELFEGLKKGKHKLYSLVLLLRRLLFVALLLVFGTRSSAGVIGALCGVQLFYVVFLVVLRPFWNTKVNVVEITNEVYLCVLLS